MTSHFKRHQQPLVFIGIFLVLALGALAVVVASEGDTGESPAAGDVAGSEFDCPRGVPDGFSLKDVEGKTFDELERWAKANGYTVRVAVEDGRPMAMTMDYSPQRINVQVESGVVTRYCGSG